MQDAQVGVFCLWRMQNQCLSQELKNVRHVSYQDETHVSKLRHMSHQAEKVRHLSDQAEKGDRDTGNMVIKDIIIILKLANQFGWLICTQFQQEKLYRNAPDPLGPPL